MVMGVHGDKASKHAISDYYTVSTAGRKAAWVALASRKPGVHINCVFTCTSLAPVSSATRNISAAARDARRRRQGPPPARSRTDNSARSGQTPSAASTAVGYDESRPSKPSGFTKTKPGAIHWSYLFEWNRCSDRQRLTLPINRVIWRQRGPSCQQSTSHRLGTFLVWSSAGPGGLDTALEWLEQSCRVRINTNPEIPNNQGRVALDAGQGVQAEIFFRRALQAAPRLGSRPCPVLAAA